MKFMKFQIPTQNPPRGFRNFRRNILDPLKRELNVHDYSSKNISFKSSTRSFLRNPKLHFLAQLRAQLRRKTVDGWWVLETRPGSRFSAPRTQSYSR